jgi:CBS domain containing-hemolysin-like protein
METAFVSANKLRVELDKKQNSLGTTLLSIFYEHPRQFISTMQTGNVLALVIFSIKMSESLYPGLAYIGNQFIIISIEILFAGIIILFTGEFLPKTIFRINPNMWLKIFSWVLFAFYIILYPVAWITSFISFKIIRLLTRSTPENEQNKSFSRDDLNYLIQESFENIQTEQEINHDVKIFQNALDFSKIRLRDCSVPRTEIIAVPIETSDEALKQTFIETGFSKIPVYKENIDNITGYIHASEMYEHLHEWRKHIRQIPVVPENMSAHKLMKMFMQQKKSIAVVVDEHGGTDGIITLEDIIEEIFGEIEDEHDNRAFVARKISETEYLFSGRCEIEHVNSKFGLNIPESDDYETVAGFILHHHQHFPKINEIFHFENFTIKCVKVSNNRIELVRFILGS